jgi:two-component system response regulator RegA
MEVLSILIVEDDEAFARTISRVLNQRGYAATHALEIEAARSLLRDHRFNYAILDLNLGKQTSLHLIPELKKSNPEMKILILTGYASIATAIEAIKLGADNYLSKPADIDEILAALLLGERFGSIPSPVTESMSVRRLEWEHIQKILQTNDGNISATARQLKMHRRTLQRKLQKRPVST